MIKLFTNALRYSQRIAIKIHDQEYTYQQLLDTSEAIALTLLNDKDDLEEARIAFIVCPGFDYAAIQWGIWRAGGIAVPLCIKHPYASLKYILADTGAEAIIFSEEYRQLINSAFSDFSIRGIEIEKLGAVRGHLPEIDSYRRAMILYTSGTTGQPKGVVSTHQNIEAQIVSLVTSWEWNQDDHILNVLPMHHVHGIINILGCALWSGACCEFLQKFDCGDIFDIFCKRQVNLFMAVPTIYYKLITYWDECPDQTKRKISDALGNFRLMVSGSAALPISVLEKWKEISGHILLERYGMTEMGMAISNPYRGERKPGFIGQPLAGVEIRLVDEQNQLVNEGSPGEIQVKGPNVFQEYWDKPQATLEAFVDGWFRSGDIAVLEQGSYRILGRNSVDIIKSGGYKISALEIEEILRQHPDIKDCGVVGIPDDEWGEIIAASIILKDAGKKLPPLQEWLRDKLPNYKIPRKYIVQQDLPRNVMGKVTKKELQKM